LSSGDINSLGLEEYLMGDAITLIEWADRLKKNILKPSMAIDIKWISEQERRIRVSTVNQKLNVKMAA
jgi:tRNA A37 threonylcarbamoyladenosine biosynthesis protein TsaE